MSITVKTQLGPYEIRSLIGSGGMGEVYLARDMRLGRTVALKVISETLSEDAAARDRFHREARAASALNHPNICTIYDVGEWHGRPYLAMEYVDGDPLTKRLRSAPLPLEELLELFIRLASALDAAHSHGIIHRDIKPDNIIVNAENHPKIMDFGLAKQVAPKAGKLLAVDSLTATWAEPSDLVTSPGSALGTVAYMSPEQARGGQVDQRSDLFSLGLIFYESATGKRAFTGNTAAVFFTALLTETPPSADSVNFELPAQLAAIIDKMIEKDRELRYQDASDLVADLRRLDRQLKSGAFPTLKDGGRPRKRWLMYGATALVLSAVAASAFFYLKARKPEVPTFHYDQITANSSYNTIIRSVLSRDGKIIAFSDQNGMYLYLIDRRERRSLARPAELSRDDRWWPVDWFPDGARLLAASATETPQGLQFATWMIHVFSGTASKVRDDCLPYAVSPDGSSIAFTIGGANRAAEIWTMDSAGQQLKPVGYGLLKDSNISSLKWSPDARRLAYRREGLTDGQVSIESIRVDRNEGPALIANGADKWGDFLWMPDGSILFSAPAHLAPQHMDLWTLPVRMETGEPAGKPRRITDWDEFQIEDISLGANGSRIQFDKVFPETDVFLASLNHRKVTDQSRRFTLDDYDDLPFFWSNDSRTLFFGIRQPGSYRIMRQKLHEDEPQTVLTSPVSVNPVRVSPDGSLMLYIDHDQGHSRLMSALISGGDGQPFGKVPEVLNVACATMPATNCVFGTYDREQRRFLFSSFEPPDPTVTETLEIPSDSRQGVHWSLSPDGKQIAFSRNASGPASISIYDLRGNLVRTVVVKGLNRFVALDWAADGQSWFVSAATAVGCAIIHVFPDANYQVVVNMRGRDMRSFSVPSPDGKHLAYLGWSITRNACILDNFRAN